MPGRRFLLERSPEEAGREVCLKTAWPPVVTALAGRHLEGSSVAGTTDTGYFRR